MSHPVPCPSCGVDLHLHGDVSAAGFVSAKDDPERKDRVDLILDCDSCGAQFNAFPAISDFVVVE